METIGAIVFEGLAESIAIYLRPFLAFAGGARAQEPGVILPGFPCSMPSKTSPEPIMVVLFSDKRRYGRSDCLELGGVRFCAKVCYDSRLKGAFKNSGLNAAPLQTNTWPGSMMRESWSMPYSAIVAASSQCLSAPKGFSR